MGLFIDPDEFFFKQMKDIEREAAEYEAEQRRRQADPEEEFDLLMATEPAEVVFED